MNLEQPKKKQPDLSRTFGRQFEKRFTGSKVVDAEGKPLRMYRGTTGDFPEFNTKHGLGTWFTSDSKTASIYASGEGGNVRPVYLVIHNPASYSQLEQIEKTSEIYSLPEKQRNLASRQILIQQGYDGITHHTYWAAFYPEQIISVFDLDAVTEN